MIKKTLKTGKLLLNSKKKGQNLSIKTMAMIVLGIMVVVLVYGAFSGWFDTVATEFTNSMEYPDPGS